MEHRWGQRVGVDLPVRIAADPFPQRAGRLANLSASGAFIRTDAELRLLVRVVVVIETQPDSRREAPTIPGYVARKLGDGVGIAWCEFAPLEITRILQSLTAPPRNRSEESESPNISASARDVTPPVRAYASPPEALFHCPLCAADAARSRNNIARWNDYLLSPCVRSMVRMGWDYTT